MTASAIERRLGLPKEFHRVLSPDSVRSASEAIETGMQFYIVRADINWKGIYWEPYIFVGAIFFLACFGMSRYSMYLERKLKTDHR